MKSLLFMLFIISGCSVTKMYRSSDLSYELKKNKSQLEIISSIVQNDFAAKEEFLTNFKNKAKSKNKFVNQDLTWRMEDLEKQKNSILIKTSAIGLSNNKLLGKVATMENIKETDPLFDEVEYFAKTARVEAIELFKEFAGYQKSSQDFYKFVVLTGNSLQSTSVKQ